MKNQVIKILAIETSCDETAAAVVVGVTNENNKIQDTSSKQIPSSNSQISNNNGIMKQLSNFPVVLSNIVSSQVDLHAKTGGVVPEVASRAHVESITPVIVEALAKANNEERIMDNGQNTKNLQADKPRELGAPLGLTPDLLSQITHIAVTVGPGLIGSLLVGFNTAKSLAYALGVPIIPVNHIEGHIYSALAESTHESTNDSTKLRNYKLTSTDFLHPTSIRFDSNPTGSQSNLHYEGHSRMDTEKNNNGTMEQWNNEIKFPILALTVSGGHTSLTLMHDHGKYETIGQTLDDAAGEAFDKVAKLLDLGYPGGPALSHVAEQFRKRNPNHQSPMAKQIPNPKSQTDCYSGLPSRLGLAETDDPESIEIDSCWSLPRAAIRGRNDRTEANTCKLKAESSISLPLPLKNDPAYNFSYSGLKTSALLAFRKAEKEFKNDPQRLELFKQELAYVFEETAVAHLIDKTVKAAKKYQVKTVLLAGGVSANKYLREQLNLQLSAYGLQLLLPPMELTGDNAAMIGLAAYYHIVRGDVSTWNEIKVDSNLKL